MKHSLLFSAALAALVLSACEKSPVVPAPSVTSPSGTGLTGSIPAPISTSPGSSTDTALPAVKPVTPGDLLSTGSQNKPNPQGSMTKQEESMAMPKPGQANDHSTPVLNPPVK